MNVQERYDRLMGLIARLARLGGDAADWEEISGPETGVGAERWFRNKKTGQEAYTCDDQGNITIEITDKEQA